MVGRFSPTAAAIISINFREVFMEYEVSTILSPELFGDILSITQGDTDFERFKNKTIIVTGAGQLLGYYIVCALLIYNDLHNAGIKIAAVESDDSIFKLYGKLTYRNDIEFIVNSDYTYLPCDKADFVIHTKVCESGEPCEAVLNLLDFIVSSSARAVFNSSADIYGDVYNGKSEISENDNGYINCADSSCSTQEKRLAESLAKKLATEGKADISLTRCGAIFGGMNIKNRFEQIIGEASRGTNPVVDRGECFPQSICYVTDAAAAILRVLLNGNSGEIYNISCGVSTSVCGFVEECAKINPSLKPVYKGKERELSPMAPTLRILNGDKLASLGFNPKVKLSDGIRRSSSIIAELKERGE